MLIGNIPVSAAAAAVAKSSAPPDLDKIEIYSRVFALFTPWVLLFGTVAYTIFSESRPQSSGYGYLAGPLRRPRPRPARSPRRSTKSGTDR
ncbi:MAG: hypothetical protein ABR499_00380 [Gemmatimonadaceae bacterium]